MSAPTISISPPEVNRKSFLGYGMAIVWAIALAKLVLHIYFNNRYGYFRDEFDYMSCGDHLQWGYVDQPPLIPFLTHISRSLLGDSLRAIRFLPALASSLLVVQAAATARQLGGRLYALVLTAICVALAPQYLSNAGLLGTNMLEPNLWLGCAQFVILAIQRNDPRYWIGFGIVAGLGMEEKYTIAVFGLGIVVGLLLTDQRRVFFNKWIWLGGLAAFLIFLPNLLWNLHYDWPFVQLPSAPRAATSYSAPPSGSSSNCWSSAPSPDRSGWPGCSRYCSGIRSGPIAPWDGLTSSATSLSFCSTARTTILRPSIPCCSQREQLRWTPGSSDRAARHGSSLCSPASSSSTPSI
jgi:Dolichyl-phosphate-mannose-protein mannosyltransferase